MARDDDSQRENLRLPPELQTLQSALSALAPLGSGLDRDQLMFEAGRAAALAELATPATVAAVRPAPRAHWFWPTTAAASLLAAAALGIVLLTRAAPRIETPLASPSPPVVRERPREPQASPPVEVADNPVVPAFWIGPYSLLGQRNRALELAAHGLPFDAALGKQGGPRVNTAITDEAAPPATDSRSLMNQLLNENSRRKTSRPSGPTVNQG